MEFELKSIQSVGGITSNEDDTMTQHINVKVGVVGCPHDDIVVEKTIKYVFSQKLSAIDIKNGTEPFAKSWVSENYPKTKDIA